jgi:tetratricopeptide (TPR) repeat protein
VYVGEQVVYQLGVFLDASVQDRVRRMEAIAPEMRGMMAYSPPAPAAGFPPRTVGGRRYVAHVYQRAIFPLTPGRISIPPAHLEYALPLSYSFFSREESYELLSDSTIVVVMEPPRAARPADWSGAVGTLSATARLDTTAARVGDPVLLTVSISGRGNVKLFPRPAVTVPWASVVPGDERVTLSTDSLDVRGAKEFDWVLTPLRAGRHLLPALRYPFFDPALHRYRVATTPPLPIEIAPGVLAADTGMVSRPPLAVRSVYRGALPPAPYSGRPFWWAVLLAPLPAAAALLLRRPRRRRTPPPPHRVLRTLAEPGRSAPPRDVRRAFLQALAERLGAPHSELAEPSTLARVARLSGVTPAAAEAAASVLAELNAAAFAPGQSGAPDLPDRAARVYQLVDSEAREVRTQRPSAGHQASRGLLALAALALALGGSARAAAPDTAAAQFARGVEAYERGHFGIATREFAALAERVPRAADAWANLGTAAFAARDTARAALGWQRALRLEPRATDVRDRLELLGGAGRIGSIPPISARAPALAALILWVGGWLALAWRPRRRSRARRLMFDGRLAASALAAAMVLGAAGAAVHARLRARDLAVVAHAAPLRMIPALAGDARATVRTGEVARVVTTQGQWALVVADGGREGWMERAALYSLARD